MGVRGLWEIVGPGAKPIQVDSLRDKRLAVDASIWIYQFLKAVRDSEGNVVKHAHVVGFFRRICKLLFLGIKPVFVFDGDAPMIKRNTIARRKQRREFQLEDAAKTARKLLTVQLKRLAESEARGSSKGKAKTPGNSEDTAGGNPEEEYVYFDELKKPAAERQAAKSTATVKFTPQDQYHLPQVERSKVLDMNDPRLMTEEEIAFYAQEFQSQLTTGLIDTSKIDFDSEEFRELPKPTQYQILNTARLRSRLRIGHTKDQLNDMFPDHMDFSRFQIDRVAQRNYLTQSLMTLVGMNDDGTAQRIVGERGREYVLQRNQNGYTLAIGENGSGGGRVYQDETEMAAPIKDEGESDDEDDEDDEDIEWEEVEVQNQNQSQSGRGTKYPPVTTAPLDGPSVTFADTADSETDLDSLFDPEIAQFPERLRAMIQASPDAPRKRTGVQLPFILKGFEGASAPVALAASDPTSATAAGSSSSSSATAASKVPQHFDLGQSSLWPVSEEEVPASSQTQSPRITRDSENKQAASTGGKMDQLQQSETAANSDEGKPEILGEPGSTGGSTRDAAGEQLPPWFHGSPSSLAQRMAIPTQADETQEQEPTPETDDENGKVVISEGTTPRSPQRWAPESNPYPGHGRGSHPILDQEFKAGPGIKLATGLDSRSRAGIELNPGSQAPELPPAPSIGGYPDEASSDAVKSELKIAQSDSEVIEIESGSDQEQGQEEDVGPNPAEVIEVGSGSDTPQAGRSQSESKHMGRLGGSKHSSMGQGESPGPEFAEGVDDAPGADPGVNPGSDIESRDDTEMAAPGTIALAQDEAEYEEKEDDELTSNMVQEVEEAERFAKSLGPTSRPQNYDAEINQLRMQARKQQRDADAVSVEMVEECQELLQRFGIPYIIAPMEAEAQCAKLMQLDLVDGIVTDDSDCFLFGGTIVYKNMFNQARWVECYDAGDLKRDFDLDRSKFIQLALLLGSDYTEGLAGIGPVTAMELLAEFSGEDGLTRFRRWWGKVQSGQDQREGDGDGTAGSEFRRKFKKRHLTKLFLSDNFPDRTVQQAYEAPEVDDDPTAFEWGAPDLDQIRAYMQYKAGWDQDRIDEILVPVLREQTRQLRDDERARMRLHQTTLDEYNSRISGLEKVELSKGKRMHKAMERIVKRRKR